jgi:dipeptidyl aminopeptidase/acylaminoacyl peptidase
VARGVHGQLSWAGNRLVTLRTGARTPTAVVAYDTTTWERTVLAIGPLSGWEDEALREPELMEVEARDGAVLHARLHRADTATDRLLCWLHGGPTDQWQVTFMPRIAYWRSRGWNVLVPDHRGSAGHGREYQQAMRGRWGELDVSDTVDVIRFAQTQGFGAPLSTVVLGGSAGGFTALGVAASAPELLAGVVASYPVTDLLDLAERSHRFERHYTESLVGPLPAALAEHVGRSPVSFATQLIATPVLLLHGDADPVVPVEQSRMLAQRIADLGGTVELHVYPGEGHGFRSVPNQLDEYARTAAFLTRVVPDQ